METETKNSTKVITSQAEMMEQKIQPTSTSNSTHQLVSVNPRPCLGSQIKLPSRRGVASQKRGAKNEQWPIGQPTVVVKSCPSFAFHVIESQNARECVMENKNASASGATIRDKSGDNRETSRGAGRQAVTRSKSASTSRETSGESGWETTGESAGTQDVL